MAFGGPPTSSPWDKALFVARFDSSGHGQWGKAFGHRLDLVGTDTAVDAAGNIVASGGSDGTSDFAKGGAPSATNDLGPVLVALGAEGKPFSMRRFGHEGDTLWTGIAVDAKNDVRYAVASDGVTSFEGVERKPSRGTLLAAVNFDAQGAVLWRREIFSSSFCTIADTTIDAAGNFYVAGLVMPPKALREDGYVVKLDPAGGVDWVLDIGDGAVAGVSGIALDPTGHLVAVGSVVGAITGPDDRLWIGRIAQ